MISGFVFPFSKVKLNSKIVIWGLGNVGKDYIDQVKTSKFAELLYVVDSKIESEKTWDGYSAFNPCVIWERNDFDYILIAIDNLKIRHEIREKLCQKGIDESKIIDEVIAARATHASFSQHGEDLLIYNTLCYMGYFVNGKKPTYMDVGAHDPYYISNTALLRYKGCKGINIEANSELINRFKEERPDDTNLCFGIGKEEGTFPFYITTNSGWNSFSKENIVYNEVREREETGKEVHVLIEKVIGIKVHTLPYVVERYNGGIWPDYLSMDIEGMEYDALSICDLTDGPKIISVEVNTDGDKFIEMMSQKGYFSYLWYGDNIIFIKKEYEIMVHKH